MTTDEVRDVFMRLSPSKPKGFHGVCHCCEELEAVRTVMEEVLGMIEGRASYAREDTSAEEST